MIYFAHHSITRAYSTELLIFLLMALVGSAILFYIIFLLITEYNRNDNLALTIVGITSMTILVFLNITYIIASYFAYYNFELKIMDRIGAQPKFINLYSWVQFQISTVKCDLGLVI